MLVLKLSGIPNTLVIAWFLNFIEIQLIDQGSNNYNSVIYKIKKASDKIDLEYSNLDIFESFVLYKKR